MFSMSSNTSPRSRTSSLPWTMLLPALLLLALLLPTLVAEPLAAQEGELKILPPPGPQRGLPAPDFTWTTTEGATVTRDGLAGKAVLIDFWASWCGPCVRAVPHLKALDDRFPDDVFQVIGINVDDQQVKLESWAEAQGVTWPQVWDQTHDVIEAFQITNFPTYILLDHQGRVSYSTSGFSPTTSRLLDYHVGKAVEAAQAARPAGASGGSR